MSQEVYISLNPEEYRRGKSNVLNCQADLLNLMKRMENIRRIRNEKNTLKIKLKQEYSAFIEFIHILEEKFPKVKYKEPEIIKEEEQWDQPEIIDIEEIQKQRNIEQELFKIQEKLRQLNS